MATLPAKPAQLTLAPLGKLAPSSAMNSNLSALGRDFLVGYDVNGNVSDFDMGDLAIKSQGAFLKDLKVRGNSSNGINIYNSAGSLQTVKTWEDLILNTFLNIELFADLQSGSYTTGKYYIATVTGGGFTKDYIYLRGASSWTEIVPLIGQPIFLVQANNKFEFFYTGDEWISHGWRQVEEINVSNVASIVIDNLSLSAWNYNITINQLDPVSVSNLRMQTSSDNGSSWKAGTTYDYSSIVGEANQLDQSQINISSTNLSITANCNLSGEIKIHRIINATWRKHMQWKTIHNNSINDRPHSYYGFAQDKSTTTINAIKLYMSTGNISSANITVTKYL